MTHPFVLSRLVLQGIIGGLNMTHPLPMSQEPATSLLTASKRLWSMPPAEQVSYSNDPHPPWEL